MRYKYQAFTAQGQLVGGYLEASSRENAVSKLREQGMLVKNMSRAAEFKLSLDMDLTPPKLNLRQQSIFFSQMAMLLKGGVPVLQSLEVLKEQARRPMDKILKLMAADVETGMPLSRAMSNRHPSFAPMATQVLSISEYSGELDRGLRLLSEQFDAEDQLQRKFISALTYPVTVLVMAFALAIFMIAFIVPNYAGMFADLGAELPWQTRALLAVSEAVTTHWYMIPILFVGFLIFMWMVKRNEELRAKVHRLYLKIFIFGPLMRMREVARYTRAMASLLKAGVPVVTAARVCADVVENGYLAKQLQQVPDRIAQGATMGRAIKETEMLPPILAELLAVGEMISNSDDTLEYIAHLSESDVKQTVERLTAIMEPVFILVLGGIVLIIVVPLLLPMFDLYGKIS
ncbi:MAG: type II secretion system F family protein [Bacillota bacterium]